MKAACRCRLLGLCFVVPKPDLLLLYDFVGFAVGYDYVGAVGGACDLYALEVEVSG